MSRTTLAAALVLGMALLAGCAPVVMTSPGVQLGATSGLRLTASQCAVYGGSPEAARMGVRSAAIQASAIRNRIQQLQARMSFGSNATGMESWRRIASGEC